MRVWVESTRADNSPTRLFTAQRKPATMFNRTVIRSDLRHTNKVIRKVLGTSGYRADLIEVSYKVL